MCLKGGMLRACSSLLACIEKESAVTGFPVDFSRF